MYEHTCRQQRPGDVSVPNHACVSCWAGQHPWPVRATERHDCRTCIFVTRLRCRAAAGACMYILYIPTCKVGRLGT